MSRLHCRASDSLGGGTDVFTSYSGAGTIEFGGGTRTLDANSCITTSERSSHWAAMTTDNARGYNVTSTTIGGWRATLAGTGSNIGALTILQW